jgi:hypothetical protein
VTVDRRFGDVVGGPAVPGLGEQFAVVDLERVGEKVELVGFWSAGAVDPPTG